MERITKAGMTKEDIDLVSKLGNLTFVKLII
jgi:hypothetical protein